MAGDLKLRDLKQRERTSSRLMNVKIPAYVSAAIDRVARDLDASKTEVVIALLNEGLQASATALKGRRAGIETARAAQRSCIVNGCREPHVAKGYCAAHYQAARRRKLRSAR